MQTSRWLLTSALLLWGLSSAHAQEYANFNLILDLDLESAERTIGLYEGLAGRPDEIAQLRGSQLALATTAQLSQRRLGLADLERSLEAAKFNQALDDDVFRMKEARTNVAAIKELLTAVKTRSFAQKVVRTVEQLFPADARVNTRIPMYLVAFGHPNIDAYVQRVVWSGSTPQFVGEGQGQLTITVNLSKGINYGHSVDERFIGVLSTVAHEVFHAAFGVYKDDSPRWRQYYATHNRPIDQLMDLTHNEGIAYYLSLIQRSQGRLTSEWERNVRAAFQTFNSSAEELLSPRTSRQRAYDLIRTSNTSGFWDSYGAITGMIIARQIDQTFGRSALMESVAAGPVDFFAKYAEVMRRDTNVPSLSPILLEEIARLRN
jgi:hypothetical protein